MVRFTNRKQIYSFIVFILISSSAFGQWDDWGHFNWETDVGFNFPVNPYDPYDTGLSFTYNDSLPEWNILNDTIVNNLVYENPIFPSIPIGNNGVAEPLYQIVQDGLSPYGTIQIAPWVPLEFDNSIKLGAIEGIVPLIMIGVATGASVEQIRPSVLFMLSQIGSMTTDHLDIEERENLRNLTESLQNYLLGMGTQLTIKTNEGYIFVNENGLSFRDSTGKTISKVALNQFGEAIWTDADGTERYGKIFEILDQVLNDSDIEVGDQITAPISSLPLVDSSYTGPPTANDGIVINQWKDTNIQMTLRTVSGTSIWNDAFGVAAVNSAIQIDPIRVQKVAIGTSIATSLFSHDEIVKFIAQHPQKAQEGALTLEAAVAKGYSETQIREFIAANPTTWLEWNP